MASRVRTSRAEGVRAGHDRDLRAFSEKILALSNQGKPRVDFLQEMARLLLGLRGCDSVEMFLKQGETPSYLEAVRGRRPRLSFQMKPAGRAPMSADSDWWRKRLPRLCRRGVLCVSDLRDRDARRTLSSLQIPSNILGWPDGARSLSLFPIITERAVGLVILRSRRHAFWSVTQRDYCRGLSRAIETALVNQRIQSALRERVKELTCLYGLARIAEHSDMPIRDTLRRISQLLPPAWQYPEISSGRVVLDGRPHSKGRFRDRGGKLSADVVVGGQLRGRIDVGYSESRPELDEGPFLDEERSLINTVARQVGLIIERKESETKSARLQAQLRHADRLATIGQLAASLAHELNGPLVSVLGFAQLTQKQGGLPQQVKRDIGKIVDASLYARGVIKNLLLFARKMPPKKVSIDMNEAVEKALALIEHQCAKSGVDLVRSLSLDLPRIAADPAQVNQVIVNLAVNAMQAMPEGGRLTVRTLSRAGQVVLVVNDTGVGIGKNTKRRIFTPFFTTKGARQGTGLGLSVVHGIVSAHQGAIRVRSWVGRGTTFEVGFPIYTESEAEDERKEGISPT